MTPREAELEASYKLMTVALEELAEVARAAAPILPGVRHHLALKIVAADTPREQAARLGVMLELADAFEPFAKAAIRLAAKAAALEALPVENAREGRA